MEQLTIELLSSSGSSFPCCDDACVGTAAAAVAALICHEGSAEAAATAISQLFPTAQAVAVHCPSASCPGQLTLGLQQAQRGTCRLTACTCSAADVLLRSAAAACTLDGSHEGEAEQATLAALGEILGQQLRQHVKQQVEVSHRCTAEARKRVGGGAVWPSMLATRMVLARLHATERGELLSNLCTRASPWLAGPSCRGGQPAHPAPCGQPPAAYDGPLTPTGNASVVLAPQRTATHVTNPPSIMPLNSLPSLTLWFGSPLFPAFVCLIALPYQILS